MLTGILVVIVSGALMVSFMYFSHRAEAKIDKELAEARRKEKAK